jgi:hypothetical protein
VIEGVNQVLLEVEDQDRALEFLTETVGFERDDLPGTYEELRGRGVDFCHPRRAGLGLVVAVRRSRGQPLRTRSARGGVRSGTKGEHR